MSAKLLDHIPWDEVTDVLEVFVDHGADRDTVITSVAVVLDKLIPLDVLVAGPAGMTLEAVDGPLLKAMLKVAWSVAANQEARAARKARRKARRK